MKGRTIVKGLLFFFIVFSLGYVVGKEVGMRAAPQADPAAQTPQVGRQLVVYYFHGAKRCAACNTIEALSHETVTRDFASEVASGRVAWKVVNKDEAWNRHYIDRYGLMTSSVVLSVVRDGEERDHANLKRVWDLYGDKAKFQSFVRGAIETYLEELDEADEDEDDPDVEVELDRE